MKVVYSRRALRQLDEILAYIEADNPRAASSVVARIEALVQLLGRYPAIGRPTDLEDVRVFRAAPYPYLIFYRVEPAAGTVTILRVRHTSRDRDWREGR